MDAIQESKIEYMSNEEHQNMGLATIMNVINRVLPVELEKKYASVANLINNLTNYFNQINTLDYERLSETQTKLSDATTSLNDAQERFNLEQTKLETAKKELMDAVAALQMGASTDKLISFIKKKTEEISQIDTRSVDDLYQRRVNVQQNKMNENQSKASELQNLIKETVEQLSSEIETINQTSRIENAKMYENHFRKLSRDMNLTPIEEELLISNIEKYINLRSKSFSYIKECANKIVNKYHQNELTPKEYQDIIAPKIEGSANFERDSKYDVVIAALKNISVDKILLASTKIRNYYETNADEYYIQNEIYRTKHLGISLDYILEYLNGGKLNSKDVTLLIEGQSGVSKDDEEVTLNYDEYESAYGDSTGVLSSIPYSSMMHR